MKRKARRVAVVRGEGPRLVRDKAPAGSGSADQIPVFEAMRLGLPPWDRFSGYRLSGRWFRVDSYVKLRNSAWLLRNSRRGELYNPAAMALVVYEAEALIQGGEELRHVLEAFAELLVHP